MRRKLIILVLMYLAKSFTGYGQDNLLSEVDFNEIDFTKTVNTDQASAWVKHYKKKKWRRHNKRFPIVGRIYDSRTCWFNIDSIRNFLTYLDGLQSSGKISNLDGIRFYYIAYRKEDYSYTHNPDYKNAHSLLWVATKKGVMPEAERTSIKDSIFHQDLMGKGNGKKIIIASTMMNTGTLCPPLQPSACKGTLLLAEADEKKNK